MKKLGSIQGVLPSGGRVGVAQEIGRGGGATVRNYTASRTSMKHNALDAHSSVVPDTACPEL